MTRPADMKQNSQQPATSAAELARKLSEIRARIEAAAQRAGRSADDVTLLPVSKTVSDRDVRTAIGLGLTRLGENRVQEIQRKQPALLECGVEWVMIGHLQTNKVKHVAPLVTEIQSLDRIELATVLDRMLQREGRAMDVLVQVKTSPEPSKYGLAPEELPAFVKSVARHMPTLRIRGLMTLAVNTDDEAAVRECFRTLRGLRDRLRDQAIDGVEMQRLSMGMSNDFEMAIEEGATEVRIGTQLFGSRTYLKDYWPEAAM